MMITREERPFRADRHNDGKGVTNDGNWLDYLPGNAPWHKRRASCIRWSCGKRLTQDESLTSIISTTRYTAVPSPEANEGHFGLREYPSTLRWTASKTAGNQSFSRFGDYVTDSDIRLSVAAHLRLVWTSAITDGQLGETKRPLSTLTKTNLWGYAKSCGGDPASASHRFCSHHHPPGKN